MKSSPLTLRKSLGISQAKLALLLGIHVTTVSKWERGVLEPTSYQLTILQTIARGRRRKPDDVKQRTDVGAWLTNCGPIETLAFLLAEGCGLGPVSGGWKRS